MELSTKYVQIYQRNAIALNNSQKLSQLFRIPRKPITCGSAALIGNQSV